MTIRLLSGFATWFLADPTPLKIRELQLPRGCITVTKCWHRSPAKPGTVEMSHLQVEGYKGYMELHFMPAMAFVNL